MGKILFVSRDFEKACDGGAVVARQHWEYVIQLSEGNAERLFIQKSSHLSLLRNLILHKGYGETSALMHRFREMAANADIIWVDGSLYGGIVREAARLGKKVVCFYHNIEANYYGSKADLARNPADSLMAYFAKSNERKSTRFASTRLLLNERDNAELQRIYGVKADFIQPISFKAVPKEKIEAKIDPGMKPYLLFVGSRFFANEEGVDWFLERVMPGVSPDIDFRVVGTICDALRDRALPPNVHLEGRVEHLTPWYANAMAVVSPIFTGSGMKTKTIEALRFGRRVLGTKEAFVGLPQEVLSGIGAYCCSASDFINEINRLPVDCHVHNPSYRLFLEKFSELAVYKDLKDFWDRRFSDADSLR